MIAKFVKALFITATFTLSNNGSFAQDFSSKMGSRSLYPKRLISEIEILLGTSYIRPRGNDQFKKILDTKFGFNAALGLSHVINTRFDINLKVTYEDKGYRFEVYQENYDYSPPATQRSIIDNTLHYTSCSISPRYKIDKDGHFYVSSGPYFGYLINESLSNEIYIDGKLISKNGARGFKSLSYETFDFGVITSVGYNLNIRSNLKATIQLNYNLGLKDISKPPSTPMWNTNYTLLLGITIIK